MAPRELRASIARGNLRPEPRDGSRPRDRLDPRDCIRLLMLDDTQLGALCGVVRHGVRSGATCAQMSALLVGICGYDEVKLFVRHLSLRHPIDFGRVRHDLAGIEAQRRERLVRHGAPPTAASSLVREVAASSCRGNRR